MKDTGKNEIEMLLRNLAKEQRAGLTANEAHLDADELNSFVEGQLPPATRSLYVTHLADCDRCRKIVAQLTPAAGLQQVQTAVQKKRTAGSYLTTFFSPIVMRYAIPALAVVILGIAGVLLIKREPGRQFVAEQTQPTPLSEVTSNTPEPASKAQSAIESDRNGKGSETKPTPAKAAGRESESAGSASGSTDKSAAKTGDTAVAAATPAAAKEAEGYMQAPAPAKTEQEAPKDTPAVASDTAAKSKAGEPNSKKADETSSNSVARNSDEERGRAETSKSASRKAAPRSAIAGSVAGGLLAQRDEKFITRSVAGRQFRRVENVWIDTAYEASTATTNITRGSEQYRALIGDEPGLRTIAEQLDGEVIVVWKGKAYRIR